LKPTGLEQGAFNGESHDGARTREMATTLTLSRLEVERRARDVAHVVVVHAVPIRNEADLDVAAPRALLLRDLKLDTTQGHRRHVFSHGP
jgi:hypothetical protein